MSDIRIVRMSETSVTPGELADLFNATFGEYEGMVPATAETMAWYIRRPGLGEGHSFLALAGQELAASTFVTAARVVFGGETVACGIIDSVMTRPRWRRRGIATALLERAVDEMRREGLGASLLYTLEGSGGHRIYSRLGYRERAVAHYYHADAVPAAPPEPGLRPARPDEEEAVRARLNAWLGGCDGYVPLDDALWRWRRRERPRIMPSTLFVLDAPDGIAGTGALCATRVSIGNQPVDLAIFTDVAGADAAAQRRVLYGLLERVPPGYGVGLLAGSHDPVLPALAAQLGMARYEEVAMTLALTAAGEAALSRPPRGWYTLGESLIGV
ncbi:MAG: GNAT family N-acetyltransferase [Armatimonadetes bacterium]|nr:GNAT family N-acetyltransferase [Armatimonadota bacterium]